MKKAVVAEINFHDNNLQQILVEVKTDSWKEAYLKAFPPAIGDSSDVVGWIDGMSNDLKEAKQEFFDGDMMIDVLYID